jgi:hypothetical protein
MRQRVLLAVLTPFLFLVPAAPVGKAVLDDPTKAPPQPHVEFANKPYPQGAGPHGIVTEVTNYSITIQRPGEPPKRFAVSEVLTSGEVPRQPRLTNRPGPPYLVIEPYMYRLSDVKVGDWVSIIYSRVGGVDTCDHINIVKRPGGLVPPLPEGVEKPPRPRPEGFPQRPFIRYHEGMNAYWDLVDKGIPYPEKFGRNRRFPVAPMPREVPIPKLRDGEPR